jgi:hypothetical protein
MAKTDNNNDEQEKPSPNVEGRHGDKTHEAFIDGLHGKTGGSEESEGAPQTDKQRENQEKPIAGHHRLHEDRQQHDEAEKNSESNRVRR